MFCELVTISDITPSEQHPFAKVIRFVGKLYQVVMTSSLSYAVGEEVLYIQDGTILPPPLLKYLNLWDEEQHIGQLYGKNGDTVRPFKFNYEDDLKSFGMIVKIPADGCIRLGSHVVDVRKSNDLDKDLGVVPITKGIPYYYRTSVCLADIRFTQPRIPEIEQVPTLFDDESEIYADRITQGRKFYVTVAPSIRNPYAFGKNHDVYVTMEGLRKYVYFSSAAHDSQEYNKNAFIPIFLHSRVMDLMNSMVYSAQSKGIFTCEVLQNVQSFDRNVLKTGGIKSLVLTDAFYGLEPFERHLTRYELNKMARMAQFRTRDELYQGPFDYEALQKLAEEQLYGLYLRNDLHTKSAYLYNWRHRIGRCKQKR